MSKAAEIARLNDQLRTSLVGGKFLITDGVSKLSQETVAEAVRKMQGFDDFNRDNDPYHEHDFGTFVINGLDFNWKIDYYDLMMEYASDDASDPSKTVRVLTLMLAGD